MKKILLLILFAVSLISVSAQKTLVSLDGLYWMAEATSGVGAQALFPVADGLYLGPNVGVFLDMRLLWKE